ncbi:MAG: hypothetical protein JNL70_17005 [Saprospiraceae bacterium]|nr:hypothetical protein [Saprospiraceae bacterium]
MKRILLLTILLYVSNLKAQFTITDSLLQAFNSATSDTARLNILFKDSPAKYLSKPQLMLTLYQRAKVIAEKNDDQGNLFKSYFGIALIYIYGLSDEGTGFQYLQKALTVAEKLKNYFDLQRVYYAMGIVQHHQNNTTESYKYLYKAIEATEKADRPEIGSFQSLTQRLLSDKRFEEYLAVNKRYIKLAERANISPTIKIQAYNSMANALKQLPDKKQDIEYYSQKAERLLDSLTITDYQTADMVIAASIYYKFNRNKKAIELLQKVLNKSANNDYYLASQGSAHELLAQIYESEKNYPLSIQHLKAYQTIENEQLVKRLTEDSGKKVIKAEAERDLLLKQKEADNNRWWAISGFSLAILVLVGAIVAYRFYKLEQERKKEVEAINATKDKLFSIIAHDLRSPIGALKSHLMMTNYGIMSQSEFANASQGLSNNVNTVFQMLENLLQWAYSQLKGIKAKPESICVQQIADIEINLLAEVATQKHITVLNRIDPSVNVYADANHMAVIMRNLISNGLKFTHPNGQVILEAHNTVTPELDGAQGDKRGCVILIKDNGIGMTQDTISQLFQMDKKTNREGTAKEKGTGLGLILTKELVELNKGQISVQSEVGKGTTFSLTF